MSSDRFRSLHDTVRVTADGTVSHGMSVPHRYHDGARIVAAPPHRAHNERRYAGLSSIPAGVDQSITLPHDCANHLRED